MKHLLFPLLLVFSVNGYAVKISSSCLSESGMSRYDLNFDTQTEKGTIRYRFMKQDTTYDAIITEKSMSQIKGVAHFSSSRTGDTSGNSFKFVYDHDNKWFSEVNVKANCTKYILD